MALVNDVQLNNANDLSEITTPSIFDDFLEIYNVGGGGNRKLRLSNFPVYNPSKFFHFYEDFVNNVGLQGGLATALSGTAASANTAALTSWSGGNIGILSLSTGSTATGRAGVSTPATSCIRLGNGRWYLSGLIRLPALSTATESYTLRCGFGDNISGDPVDGVYLRYNDAVNGGKFACVCRSNNVEVGSAIDSGIIVAANTDYRYGMMINANGTSAIFTINGVTVATVTANIPVGSGRETGLLPISMIKGLGVTPATALIDYSFGFCELTNTR